MKKPVRAKWPQREFEVWRNKEVEGRRPIPDEVADMAALIQPMVDDYIDHRCFDLRIGSPDIRLLAQVDIWAQLVRLAEEQMVISTAKCQEESLPWAATSEASDSASVTTFCRRYRERVEKVINEHEAVEQP